MQSFLPIPTISLKPFRTFILYSALALGSTFYATPAQSQSNICSATGTNLFAAKNSFEGRCDTTYNKSLGHDCDPACNGGWICQNQSINLNCSASNPTPAPVAAPAPAPAPVVTSTNSATASSMAIVVRARGRLGSEKFSLRVNGQTL